MTTSAIDALPVDFAADLPREDLARQIGIQLGIKPTQVLRTIELLDDKNTIPFIARYRKEVTGSLDEVQIQDIEDAAASLRALHDRKGDVLRLINEQGKLTPELAQAIAAAKTMQAVDDLYLPYRQKRKTRASVARERGLGPLAEQIITQARIAGAKGQAALEAAGAAFIDAEKSLPSLVEVLAGARDIVAETISEDATVRGAVRQSFLREGGMRARLAVSPEELAEKDPKGVYQLYYDFSEPLTKLAPHRVLAINRAEREDVLRVGVEVEPERALPIIFARYPLDSASPFATELAAAAADGYKRLLAPSIEREVRAEITQQAEEHAISIFATNVRNLLLQPPLRGYRILGIDPGFRTGCKISIIDETGKYLEGSTIFPHPPQRDWEAAKRSLMVLCAKHGINAIAIGNGTASRETEQLVAETIREMTAKGVKDVPGYMIVSEAGASVYSASEVARQEFPTLEATQRGGISIARRLLDPLAELVKIDPKAIGVGLYQHDVDQRELGKELERVVTSCVNFAGVDVNAASAPLLRHVSGINTRVAEAIVAYREEHGPFVARTGLKKVPGLGPAAFVQAAGFLKIPNGKELLDMTFIHPESYAATQQLLDLLPGEGKLPERVKLWRSVNQLQSKHKGKDGDPLADLAAQLGIGVPTLSDILDNLEKPGLDPREGLDAPILRHDVLSLDDLHEGMTLQGTIRNVVDFGAFVDIGVKNDGLVHVSELADHFVRDPTTVVAVGQVVQVRVLGVDKTRGRVQLSMRGLTTPR
ncbi:MAG: RNA-binding transcriptional accessory protein [Ktedonobacterales bacterium]|nr:RNA-binding transcriptional accessory protein [Ktedonobacterales bacterium]